MNWTEYFREIAQAVAKKSKDKKTHIGAVIVGKHHQIISTGYNSFPRGIDDNVTERHERPEKYFWFEHAERNSIYNAARSGVSTNECTIYLSHWFPCSDCARAIINSGITTLYCNELDTSKPSTTFDASFQRGLTMLNEVGITIKYYD